MSPRSVFALSLLVMPFALAPAARGQDAPAAADATFTHEDVWLTKRLGTPVPDPDGRRAVVAVTEPSYEKDGTVSDLWLVDVGGDAAPRRLTATPEAESGVEWSPDGTRIAFSAQRGDDETSQVYVLDMTGPGEAVRITSLSTGAESPKWSPDGRRIAFESRVYPGALDDEANAAEKKAREEREINVSSYDEFPIRQWNRWRDDLEVHLFVQDAEPGAEARDLLAGTALVSGPGYSGAPSLAGDGLQAAWAPDGTSLVFVAATSLHEAARKPVVFGLYGVSTGGGEPVRLTRETDASCTSPQFGPDGDTLYCLHSPENEHVYNLTGIARWDWSGDLQAFDGEARLVTDGLDRSVGEMTISADGRTLYATAADAGRVRVYAIPAAGGNANPLDEGSRGAYAGPRTAGRSLVARWEDSATPAEIVRVDTRTGEHRALTAFNDAAREQVRPAFREFWFTSSKGRRIHSWVAVPFDFDPSKQYPLVLLIHGGPFASSLDADHVRWSPHLLAAPGYVVVMPDYTGSVGYGEAFSRAIQGDPLATPGEELLEAADEAIRLYDFVDGERQAAAGASYGGHLINWLQATTTRFDALVGHAGLVSLEGQWSTSDTIFHREIMNGGPVWADSPVWEAQSPSTYADRFATPVLLTIGEKDYRVPINQTIAAWSYLKRRNVPGRLLVFHDADHWIMNGPEARYYWEQVHAWLATYLGRPGG